MYIDNTSSQTRAFTLPVPKMASQAGAAGDGVAASDKVPVVNPSIDYNYQAGIAVLVIRNPDTGKVETQYPSQKVVDEYIRQGATAAADTAPRQAAGAGPASGTTEAAAPSSGASSAPAPAVQTATPVGTGTDQLA